MSGFDEVIVLDCRGSRVLSGAGEFFFFFLDTHKFVVSRTEPKIELAKRWFF